jgi:hypothetical protein
LLLAWPRNSTSVDPWLTTHNQAACCLSHNVTWYSTPAESHMVVFARVSSSSSCYPLSHSINAIGPAPLRSQSVQASIHHASPSFGWFYFRQPGHERHSWPAGVWVTGLILNVKVCLWQLTRFDAKSCSACVSPVCFVIMAVARGACSRRLTFVGALQCSGKGPHAAVRLCMYGASAADLSRQACCQHTACAPCSWPHWEPPSN